MHFAHMHQIWLFLYLENTFSTFLSYADLVVEWKLSILVREIKDKHWQLNIILIRFEDLDLIIELSRNFIMTSGQKSLSSSLLRRPDTRWNWSFERFLEGWKTENISSENVQTNSTSKRQKNQITDLKNTLTHSCGGLLLLGNFPQSEKSLPADSELQPSFFSSHSLIM